LIADCGLPIADLDDCGLSIVIAESRIAVTISNRQSQSTIGNLPIGNRHSAFRNAF
jgi:hypothetical protein